MYIEHLNPSIDRVTLLSREESESPVLVFQQFFEMTRLDEIKGMLNDCVKQLTSTQYGHVPGTIEYDNTIYLFERLEKLLEAAYIIR